MSRTVLFSALVLEFFCLGWAGTVLPLCERFVVPVDDLRVYSFNGTKCRCWFAGGFAVFGVECRI
jgi:hypothetical protein